MFDDVRKIAPSNAMELIGYALRLEQILLQTHDWSEGLVSTSLSGNFLHTIFLLLEQGTTKKCRRYER